MSLRTDAKKTFCPWQIVYLVSVSAFQSPSSFCPKNLPSYVILNQNQKTENMRNIYDATLSLFKDAATDV